MIMSIFPKFRDCQGRRRLPRDRSFVVHVEAFDSIDSAAESSPQSALQWLAENAIDDELPSDLSAQHDHYLYGTPKRG